MYEECHKDMQRVTKTSQRPHHPESLTFAFEEGNPHADVMLIRFIFLIPFDGIELNISSSDRWINCVTLNSVLVVVTCKWVLYVMKVTRKDKKNIC